MSSISGNKTDEVVTTVITNIKNSEVKSSNKSQSVDVPVGEKTKNDKPRVYDFTLGPVEENAMGIPVRLVGPGGISVENSTGCGSILAIYNNLVHNTGANNPSLNNPDGYFENSNQGFRGDCYLLAEINAIRNTKHGQEILKQNIKINADNSVTVTLPGAIKFRNECLKNGQGEQCEVTGTYHITSDAINKAKKLAGQSYSKGDIEVIALEIAMENFRAEMVQTNKNLGNNRLQMGTLEGMAAAPNVQNGLDYLSGGQSYDAAFLLTGQKSDVYQNINKRTQIYHDGQYGYITVDEMERQTGFDSHLNNKGMTTVSGGISSNDSKLGQMLNKYEGQEDKYSLVVYVKTERGGHAISVVKITDDVIYIANPWHPDKIEPVPRNDFEKMAHGFVATEMSVQNITNTHNTNTITQITNNIGNTNQVNHNQTNSMQNILQSLSGHFNLPSENHGTVLSGRLSQLISDYNRINSSGNSNNNIDTNRILGLFNNLSHSNAQLSPEEETFLSNIFTKLSHKSETRFSPEEMQALKEIFDKYSS